MSPPGLLSLSASKSGNIFSGGNDGLMLVAGGIDEIGGTGEAFGIISGLTFWKSFIICSMLSMPCAFKLTLMLGGGGAGGADGIDGIVGIGEPCGIMSPAQLFKFCSGTGASNAFIFANNA
jgi:hypothetical protein